jgi:hypothetical protein
VRFPARRGTWLECRSPAFRELRRFLVPEGSVGKSPASVPGPECIPVRAILFDKSAGQNWSLGWHQDRIDVEGFEPWSTRTGMVHVEPPFDLLAGMVTLRVHPDAVTATNTPLLIASGSHKHGRISTAKISDVARGCEVVQCLAEAGDIWLYATPILHASDAAAEPRHRRVLQVDYSTHDLPGGSEWQGVQLRGKVFFYNIAQKQDRMLSGA